MAANFPDDPLLGALVAYWESKRGNRPMPRRRDIDPLEMPVRLLPFVQLIEVGEGGRLRFRLIGTAIVDAMGRDATGRYVDAVLKGDHLHFVERYCATAFRAKRPVYGRCSVRSVAGGALATYRVAAPLGEVGCEPSMILSATRFGAGGRGAIPPLSSPDIIDSAIDVL
jgi:hypothetical protein